MAVRSGLRQSSLVSRRLTFSSNRRSTVHRSTADTRAAEVYRVATRVIMPTLGLTMEQGTVVRWLKREGDAVEREEPLFTVETDKATMDVGAPAAGILARVLVAEGVAVPVLETIALITTPGEAALGTDAGGPPAADATPVVTAAPVARKERSSGRDGWPASPRARRVAA